MADVPKFDSVWRLSCTVELIGRHEAEPMIRRHYIGKWPGVCVLILGLKQNAQLLGIIVFALPPRETSRRFGGKTWELARLWINDAVPRNAETFLIGRAVKYIRRHHHDVAVLVSYADPSAGHSGTIYKAANWLADGRTDQDRKTPRFDYYDNTGKRYGRRNHVPNGTTMIRIPRVSKYRFVYRL